MTSSNAGDYNGNSSVATMKPHIDIGERLPDDTMRVMNKCAGLEEDSREVKFVVAFCLKGDELVKYLLAPHYAEMEKISAKDVEEETAVILGVDSDHTLKMKKKSGKKGKKALCKMNYDGTACCYE